MALVSWLANRWKIGTKIGAGFALGLAVFITLGIVSYRGTERLISTARQEKHTYQVLGELEEIFSLLKDAETGQRGYLLTGENRYLDPYNQARTAMPARIDQLRLLVKDNQIQESYLQTLEPLIAQNLPNLIRQFA
jgi:CHASE3 domain sensor protein